MAEMEQLLSFNLPRGPAGGCGSWVWLDHVINTSQNLSSEAVEEVNVSVIAEEVATNLSDSLSRFRHFLNVKF